MSAKTMIARRIERAAIRAKRAAKRKLEKEQREIRGRTRRFLALQMGMLMLNRLESVGCYCIRDYTRIRPKSVINAYVNNIAQAGWGRA